MAKAKANKKPVTQAPEQSEPVVTIRNEQGQFPILIKKTGRVVNVDFDGLPEQSKEYLIAYGLKQRLNDCHSDITEKSMPDADNRAAAVDAAVNEVLQALAEGKVSLRKSGTGTAKLGKKTKARALAILLAEVNNQSEAMNLGIIDSKGFDNVAAVARTKYDIQESDIIAKAGELVKESADHKADELADLI